jgi:hypothetical protein
MRNGTASFKTVANKLVQDRIAIQMDWSDKPRAGGDPKIIFVITR